MNKINITELLGDGIGPELRESVYAVAEALPLNFNFIPFDLSLENRESGDRDLFDKVIASMHSTKLALKYPTVTKTASPNAIIRRRCNFSVILRPVISIKGIKSHFTEEVFLYIVRIATGGTYDDPGRPIGKDAAISIRIVERDPCRQAARYAFEFARKKKLSVTSSSKHTIQRATDGLFESVVSEVHEQYPDIEHHVELFDALLAKIILKPVSFRDDDSVDIAMFDPSGGTAPDIAGQNKCNPTAILLALGMLLDHIDRYDLGHELRMAMLSCVAEGVCTADIGGRLGTREFTREVIERMKGKF
uniref:Isocitrate/isopropylmalate dehydrogenase n=1 Tax=uncultured gamma proteobacterium Rifle_16ft_4_minimus_38164 TaxID=1665199 RepID=A0A0H4TXN6_9GAMM|nr:isocitrate/isopropylmalate dehydrogenase [uncultured gamma proteobacterium Rifle_16ft_4_minimus_38164]